ncbi:hypothetical protein Tco_0432103 [Tanacetum coccineum]
MHHSMCSSTSNLVFMTLVLSLWAIPLVVPLIPTFIAISLLTCPRASLVVSSIVICRSPTVTDHMAHYVAPVAFGRTWTIMMIVAFRTQRLGPVVIFLLPVPCSVSFTSILPLVRLLLVRDCPWKCYSTPSCFSLACVFVFPRPVVGFSYTPGSCGQPSCNSHSLQYIAIVVTFPNFLLLVSILANLHFVVRSGFLTYGPWNQNVFEVLFQGKSWSLSDPNKCKTLMLSLSDLSFSGGGDDEGSAAANLVMHVSADGDCEVRHQQIEADPSLVPLAPHQKLNGISMAQN